MKPAYLPVVILCFFLANTPVIANPAESTTDSEQANLSDDDLQQLLELSGVMSALQQLEPSYQLNLQRQQQKYSLSGEQAARLAQTIANYRSDVVLAELRRNLPGLLAANKAQKALEYLQSDLNRRFRRFERSVQQPVQQQKFAEYRRNNKLDNERISLLRACHVADMGHRLAAVLQSFAEVDTAVALDFVSGEMISRSDSKGVQLWRHELEQAYADRYTREADDYLHFAYRFLRNEQLQEYAQLWSKQELQWFMETVLAELRRSLRAMRAEALAQLK